MTSWDWKTYKPDPEEAAYREKFRACRVEAVTYLAGRVRTSGQARVKLEGEFSPEIIEDVIADLEDEGYYLHDEKVALYILEERRGARAEGRPALYKRLKNRGVKESIIRDVLDKHVEDRVLCAEFMEAKASDLLEAYLREEDPQARQKALARLVRKAGSRAFGTDLALTWIRDKEKLYKES